MDKSFLTSEAGGATVDWILISALIVALGLSVMTVMATGLDAITAEISARINSD